MLPIIAVLLSFGAVYAYIPIIIIVILIAAAAGLSRGTDIFAIFGIGTLIGAGAVNKKGGFSSAFKTKNDLISRRANAGKFGSGLKKSTKGIAAFRAARAAATAKTAAAAARRTAIDSGGMMSAAAIAAAVKKAGGNRKYRKAYEKSLKEELHNFAAAGSPLAPGLKGVKGAAAGLGAAGAAGIAGAGAAGAAAAGKGTTDSEKSKWATRINAKEYLISEAKGMKEGQKYKSKTIIKPTSPEATVDILAVKANPRNLDENIRDAANKKDAKLYQKEQQAAWNELLRRSRKDESARTAVNGLLNIYGLEHPKANSNNAYVASGNRDQFVKTFEERYNNYKEAGWSPKKRREVREAEEAAWLKKTIDSDAGRGDSRLPKLDELYKRTDLARSLRNPGQDIYEAGSFSKAMKNKAKKVKEVTDSTGKPISNTTLEGSGWKKYYKETHKGKKKP